VIANPSTLSSPATSGEKAPAMVFPLDSEAWEQRIRRIEEFTKESLAKANALEANLGAIAGEIMLMVLYLRVDLDRVRTVELDPMERLHLQLLIGEQLSKLSKQLDSLISLEMRLREERRRIKVAKGTRDKKRKAASRLEVDKPKAK
jgi:hypothetical protein